MQWLQHIAGRVRDAKRHRKPSTITEDRPLTPAEAEFIRWLLDNGSDHARQFLAQLNRARVIDRCSCGCASINLSIDGNTYYGKTGMEVLCEYRWNAAQGEFGVFAFACGDLLAGIDLWTVWGDHPASYLPATSLLRPDTSPNAA